MTSVESPVLSSSRHSDSGVSRRRGLELFCLSFLALFLELMVIRWAPAVVRLVAYYANLMLISSFLVWHGSDRWEDKKVVVSMVSGCTADQYRIHADCSFCHHAECCHGESILRTDSPAGALCMPDRHFRDQRNCVRAIGPADWRAV